MNLVSFDGGYGRVEDDSVVPMGDDIVAYLNGEKSRDGQRVPLADVKLRPAVPSPEKIICVGLNYRDHAAETRTEVPSEPILFAKFRNSLVAAGAPIRLPAAAPDQVDYEAELAVVIGKHAVRVGQSAALEYVAGYTCANDVSARDLQMRGSQWLRGKAIDTFLPLGPWIATTDEIEDPGRLEITCTVNGETLQHSSTAEMVFGVAQLVSFISQTIALAPGDIICTGTPAGVGFTRKPPRFLSPGDTVSVRIERIGELTNSVSA